MNHQSNIGEDDYQLIKWVTRHFDNFLFCKNEKNTLQFFGIFSDQTPAWQQNCLTWCFLPANNTRWVFVYTKSCRLSNYWINFSEQPAVLLVSTGHIWSVFVISWLLIDTIVEASTSDSCRTGLSRRTTSICLYWTLDYQNNLA